MSIALSQACEGFFLASQACRRLSVNTVADYSVTLRNFQAFVNYEEIVTRLPALNQAGAGTDPASKREPRSSRSALHAGRTSGPPLKNSGSLLGAGAKHRERDEAVCR